ncbi:hypothetical protein ACIGKQ_25330 [Gordonia sp. NPDC062954]|jgi:uncharacterized protein YjbI with pentapeptide repeats|uniref:hypothetical protein n=1 Tax=Gordonia sp. NPDC062954 TaxID=3364003 RepID=UPI0037C93548
MGLPKPTPDEKTPAEPKLNTEPKPNKHQIQWALFGLLIIGLYFVPPGLYWALADDENWGEFFKAAAIPYGATTAGLLALTAGALAFHNGGKDREARQHVDDRRDNAETIRELRARYTTAVEQLANTTTTISQAGAYAIAALADDWLRLDLPNNLRINTHAEAQTCINILCTYLRTDHPNYNPDPTPNSDRRQPDQPVRDTILSTITAHLRPNPPGESWQHLNYDFTEASFHNANFGSCTFLGETTTFTLAKFHGARTSFDGTQFHGENLLFPRAEFYGGQADFTRAQFNSSVNGQFDVPAGGQVKVPTLCGMF